MKIFINKGPENDILVLVNKEYLWKYNLNETKWEEVSLNETYPNLEHGFVGGVKVNNLTWFFKSKKNCVFFNIY